MDTIVGLKEVRKNIDHFVKGVQKGRSFIVMRKSKPLFRLSPIIEREGRWKRIVDFTKIKKGGVLIKDIHLEQLEDIISEMFSPHLQKDIAEARQDFKKGKAVVYRHHRLNAKKK